VDRSNHGLTEALQVKSCKKHPALLALSALLAIPPISHAAPDEAHWYATGILGANFMSDKRLDFSGSGATGSAKTSLDPGLFTGAAVGYAFNRHWRVEAEFSYQSVEHDGVDLGDSGSLPSGNYASTALALNGLYSFNAFGSEKVRTYLGAGVAWLTEVDIDFERGGDEQSYSGDGIGLQLLGGARYDIGDHLFVDAGLRYLTAGEIELDGEGSSSGRIKADYDPWAVTIAVGWRF
jgi:opacity protein-like surface antigen